MALLLLAFAFGFGLLIGALTAVLLRMRQPNMPASLRRRKASLPAPVVLIALALLGALGVVVNGWQQYDDLALVAIGSFALFCSLAALAGGFIGASLVERHASS